MVEEKTKCIKQAADHSKDMVDMAQLETLRQVMIEGRERLRHKDDVV